jgi:hypothetical protein
LDCEVCAEPMIEDAKRIKTKSIELRRVKGRITTAVELVDAANQVVVEFPDPIIFVLAHGRSHVSDVAR